MERAKQSLWKNGGKGRMSNDLISRSAVLDYLREQQANVIIEKNKNGFVPADVCDGMSSAIDAFMNFILQVPTAYDFDGVVERLKEERENAWDLRDGGARYSAYDNALDIVRSGIN